MTDNEKQLLIKDAVNDYFFDIEKYLGKEFDTDDYDNMLYDALGLLKHYDFISISMIMRLLRIGESRAVDCFI